MYYYSRRVMSTPFAERPEVEQRVLRAAKKLFMAQGIAKTPLRTIAAEARTSESGILRFYKDKDDLACAVMDLCWVDINDQIAEALRVGSERSDDPRFLLMEVVGSILGHASSDRQQMSFLISHFHYTLSGGSDEAPTEIDHSRFTGYSEYRRTIDELCARIAAYDPGLREAGITQAGLCHLTLALVYGVTGGWYLSERDPVIHGPGVPMEDALSVLRKVVYPSGTC